MKEMYEVLKILLPSLVVLFTVYTMLRAFISEQENQRKLAVWQDKRGITLPLRLQAYERLVLFLERISPEALLLRVDAAGLTASELQSSLLTILRTEFEHNVSQQIYVSPEAWDAVRNARSYTARLIQLASTKISPDAPALAFSTALMQSLSEVETTPGRHALEMLRTEAATLFV